MIQIKKKNYQKIKKNYKTQKLRIDNSITKNVTKHKKNFKYDNSL